MKIVAINGFKIILVLSQIFVVSAFYQQPVTVLILTSIVAILMLSTMSPKRNYILIFLVFGLFGAASEFFPVLYGAWSYATDVPIGLPYYLPVLWGSAAVAIVDLSKQLDLYS